MNKYVLLAMNELEAGNYDAYQAYMKLNKDSRGTRTRQHDLLTDEGNKNYEKETTGQELIARHYKRRTRHEEMLSEEKRIPNRVEKKAITLPDSNGGIQASRNRNRWIAEENLYIRENYQSLSDKKMASVLGRTVEAVKSQRKNLELKRDIRKPWAEEELDYLRKHFRNQSLEQMGKALARPPKQVSSQMNKIGLSKINRYEMYVAGRKVASGTIKEISEQINANLYTVKSWRTNGVSWATFKKCNEN